jgi:hypothetical protein
LQVSQISNGKQWCLEATAKQGQRINAPKIRHCTALHCTIMHSSSAKRSQVTTQKCVLDLQVYSAYIVSYNTRLTLSILDGTGKISQYRLVEFSSQEAARPINNSMWHDLCCRIISKSPHNHRKIQILNDPNGR